MTLAKPSKAAYYMKENIFIGERKRAEGTMLVDQKAFRTALGRFATGVTIATTLDDTGAPVGLTANSFNSVSMDPPLILWSLARASCNLGHFQRHGRFAINVLSADQAALCQRFASPVPDRFAGVDWEAGLGGVPVLTSSLAVFECVTENEMDGGDHVIFLGRVARFGHGREAAGDQSPLIFYDGRIGPAPAARHGA